MGKNFLCGNIYVFTMDIILHFKHLVNYIIRLIFKHLHLSNLIQSQTFQISNYVGLIKVNFSDNSSNTEL